MADLSVVQGTEFAEKGNRMSQEKHQEQRRIENEQNRKTGRFNDLDC